MGSVIKSIKTDSIDVVVLCGGEGSRLKQVVSDRPKPMADINGVPFLDILFDYLKRFGFKRFVLCTGYMADFIESYYKEKKDTTEILFSYESNPLGTAGAIKNAEKLLHSNTILVLNGDSFCTVDLLKYIEFHRQKKALLSIALLESNETSDFGQIVLDENEQVISFKEKSNSDEKTFINSGIYLFEKQILSMIPTGIKYSLEYDLFPKLVDKGLYGFRFHGKFIDIGTPESYLLAEEFFSRGCT